MKAWKSGEHVGHLEDAPSLRCSPLRTFSCSFHTLSLTFSTLAAVMDRWHGEVPSTCLCGGVGGQFLKELPLLAAPKRLKASKNCSSCVLIGRLKTGEMSLIVMLYYWPALNCRAEINLVIDERVRPLTTAAFMEPPYLLMRNFSFWYSNSAKHSLTWFSLCLTHPTSVNLCLVLIPVLTGSPLTSLCSWSRTVLIMEQSLPRLTAPLKVGQKKWGTNPSTQS